MRVKRIYVEKKKGFQIEAQGLLEDLRTNLGMKGLTSVRIINRYDMEGTELLTGLLLNGNESGAL